jgi:hypothetical protein
MSSNVLGISRDQDGFLVDLDLLGKRPSRCLLFLLMICMSASFSQLQDLQERQGESGN